MLGQWCWRPPILPAGSQVSWLVQICGYCQPLPGPSVHLRRRAWLPSLPRSLTTLPAAPSCTLCAAACYLQVNAAVRAGGAYLRDVLLHYPGEVIAAAAALGLRRVLKAAGRLVRRQFLRLADVHGLPAIASWLALMPKAQVGWGSQQACCGAAGPCGAGRTARL